MPELLSSHVSCSLELQVTTSATIAVQIAAAEPPGSARPDEAITATLDGRPLARRDDLQVMVRMTLHAKYDEEPTVDDDGDVVLTHMDQPVWVRARPDMPAVEIFARVVHDVHSRRATAVEIGLLNRDNLWVRWTLRERTVWQTLLLPASPFVPSHLDEMLDLYLAAMSETRDDLAYRTGAKVA